MPLLGTQAEPAIPERYKAYPDLLARAGRLLLIIPTQWRYHTQGTAVAAP